MHPAAVFQFALDEGFVVVGGGGEDGVVVGVVGLDDDAAGKISAAGAAGDLGHELEDAFGGAEVGHGEGVIAADDADERDAVDIVSFGDHLGADEEIDFAGVEAGEEALQVVAAADGVAVHAADAGGGKDFAEDALRLAGSRRRGSRDVRCRTWGSAWERCDG